MPIHITPLNQHTVHMSNMPRLVADAHAAAMMGIAVPVGQSPSAASVISWWRHVISVVNPYLRTDETQVNLTAVAIVLLARANINDSSVAYRWPQARTGIDQILLAGQGQPGIVFD